MPMFNIIYGIGQYDENFDEIEAEDHEEAELIAYESARELAESEMHYSAEEIDPDAETDEE